MSTPSTGSPSSPAPSASPASRPAVRLSWRELGWISLCFAVLTLVFAYPVSVHPATLRLDTGIDGDLGWYLLSWDTHAFLHRPWAIFDANIYHPSRFTLAYGENIIGLALLAAPVIWLTGSAPMGSTFVSLSACFISGLGAYVLARRLRASVIAAIVALLLARLLGFERWLPASMIAVPAVIVAGSKAR